MAFTPVNDGDLAVAPQVQQIIDALSGVAGAGQAVALTALESSTDPSLALQNLDAAGWALHVYSSSGADLFDIRNASTSIDNGTLYVDHANNRVGINDTSPTATLDITGSLAVSGAATFGSLGATAFTGRVGVPVGTGAAPGLYFDTAADEAGVNSTDGSNVSLTTGGAARLTVTDGATTVANALTLSSASLGYIDLPLISAPSAPASGTRLYTKSGGGVYARTAAGSERQILDAGGFTAEGDLLYGTGALTFATLAKGTARQMLQMNSGATAPQWVASPASILTNEGDILYAVSANTPARWPRGTAHQVLGMQSAANTLEWKASLQSLMTAQGDILYASAANTPAALAKGAAYQELVMNSGATAPQWANGVLQQAAAAGDIFYATGANAIDNLGIGTKGYTLLADTSAPKWEPISRKNLAINGDFRVSGRYAVNTGLVVVDNTVMTADKWRMLYDTASNAPSTYTSTSFFGSTAGASLYSLVLQASNTTTGRHGVFHAIESKDVAAIRGRTVSLSFLAFAQSSFSDIRAAVLYRTGTGDAITADPVTTWASLASGTPGNASGLSGSWLFANTPSNLGITAGGSLIKIENVSIPQAATNVAVLIWCDDTSTTFGEFWGITNVQLERGSICTEFESRPCILERSLCGDGIVERRNRLINGCMRVYQRGVVDTNYTGTDNTYVGPDRWRTLTETTTPSVRQSNVWIPSTNSSNKSWLALSGGNHRFGLFQVLESADCWDLRGQTVSLQFMMATPVGTNISDVRAAVIQFAGTADAVSGDPITTWSSLGSATAGTQSGLSANWTFANTPSNLSPTTSWAKYKVENVSISSSATNVAVLIWVEDTTHTLNVDHLDVTDVQMEKGSVCTEFERRPYAQELALCQRYYFKTFPQSVAPAQNTGNANGALGYVNQIAGTTAGNGAMLRYPMIMHHSPTVTFYNISASNTKWRNVTIGADSATPVTVGPNETGLLVTNAQVAGDLVSNQLMVHLTADAEL